MADVSRRRSFFRSLARELLVEADELRGVRYITYDQLLSAPDEKLGWLVPVVRRGVAILPSEGKVIARMTDGTPRILFQTTELSLLIFNSFNGRNTLDEVGRIASRSMGWPEKQGFQAARALFLKLVVAGVAESCRYWT